MPISIEKSSNIYFFSLFDFLVKWHITVVGSVTDISPGNSLKPLLHKINDCEYLDGRTDSCSSLKSGRLEFDLPLN